MIHLPQTTCKLYNSTISQHPITYTGVTRCCKNQRFGYIGPRPKCKFQSWTVSDVDHLYSEEKELSVQHHFCCDTDSAAIS